MDDVKTLLLGGLITLAVTLLTQSVARGGRRRRAMDAAARELDLAAKFPEGSSERQRLEAEAARRMLAELQERPARWPLVGITALGAITGAYMALSWEGSGVIMFLVIGVVMAWTGITLLVVMARARLLREREGR